MEQFNEVELKILKKSPLLKDLTDKAYEETLKMGKRIFAQKGEMILTENQESDMLYIILSGKVGLYKLQENDLSETKIARVSVGESLGEMRLGDTTICSLSAVAEDNVTLFALSVSELKQNKNNDYLIQLLDQVIKILNKRLVGENFSFVSEVWQKKLIKKKYSLTLISVILLTIILIESGFMIHYLMNKTDVCQQYGYSNSETQSMGDVNH